MIRLLPAVYGNERLRREAAAPFTRTQRLLVPHVERLPAERPQRAAGLLSKDWEPLQVVNEHPASQVIKSELNESVIYYFILLILFPFKC